MGKFNYKNTLSTRAKELYKRYDEVKRWFDEVSSIKSERVAYDYIDMLAGFVKDTGISPRELCQLSPKGAFEAMKGWAIGKLSSISTGRLHVIWYAVKSYLDFNGVEVKGGPPFRRVMKYLDKIPTKEELKVIIDSAPNLSTKIAINLMAYSGIRPEDICDLTYSCIKADFEKGVVPCAIYVPQGKGNNVYITFAPEPTLDLLRRYFRLRRGERLHDESPILVNSITKVKGIRRKTLTWKIRRAMERSGIQLVTKFGDKVQRMRPYSLRKYFRSNLTGHVASEYIEAWMGHTSGLAHVYGGTKDLDPTTIEHMREAYRGAWRYLSVEGGTSSKEELVLEAIRKFAESFGIEPMRIRIEKQKELGRELTLDEEIKLLQNELKKLRNSPSNDPKRIVSEGELERYLAEGWDVQTVLLSGRILIRKVG